MASNARIFFAGVGTTFIILGIGFGGGLMLAKSALHDSPAQGRASSHPAPGMRVILPASAEPALQVTATAPASEIKPQPQAGKEAQSPGAETPAQNAESKKINRERMERQRRYAERKAKRIAAAKARQRIEWQEAQRPAIMAFGRDEPQMSFFGN